MSSHVFDLITGSALSTPQAIALQDGKKSLTYQDLQSQVLLTANLLLAHRLLRAERVGVYLEKRIETVIALFGAAAAGGAFVPVNPLLKPEQVGHILIDCNVRILVTSPERLELLRPTLSACADLHTLIIVGETLPPPVDGLEMVLWRECEHAPARAPFRVIDADMAALLYTSGSTGRPKGVVLSHRNILAGAASVSQYLENTADDRILSVLPLSFDYGLNQLTTAFRVGRMRSADELLVAARCDPRGGARKNHRPGRRAALVGATRATGMAGRCFGTFALHHQFRRAYA